MTAVAGASFRDPAPSGHLLLWGSAALVAFLAHAGLAAWALRQPPLAPADAAAAAVMIELAPAPAAPKAAAPQVAPDVVDQADVLTQIRPDTPPAPVLSVADPLPDVTRPARPEPPVTDSVPPVDIAAVAVPEAAPRPMARPETLSRPAPPDPQRSEPTPDPARDSARDSARASAREKPREQRIRTAAVAAPAAAAANISGRGAAQSPARWQSRLLAHLERRKRYPSGSRSRHEEGVVHVSFAIDAAGNVLSSKIARSSGHVALDAEVLALVRRASPVPAPPPGAPRQITAPVQFRIR